MNLNTKHSPSVYLRLVLIVLVLAVGIGGFIGLKKMKKPPQQAPISETTLAADVITVQPATRQVSLRGYGEIRSRTEVPLSAEVSGRILTRDERLEAGGVVPKGTVLFTIDQQDYQLDYTSAVARLKALDRDLTLARGELQRVNNLYRNNKVGTLSSVEQAESAVNSIVNQISQVQQVRDLAALRIKRCTIYAPFTGRVTEVNGERDEYVTVGRKLITLVNDAELELHVALDSQEAAKWLQLEPKANGSHVNWFGSPVKVKGSVTWTESEAVNGAGVVDRIVRFDPETRTLVIAIRLEPDSSSPFPLTAGMFCRVDIPGLELAEVFEVPRQAVTFENTVYLVRDERLHTVDVKVVRVEGEKAYIGSGLSAGDTVIINRLENPLEKMLVKVSSRD